MAIPLRLKIYRDDNLVEAREFERDLIKIGRLASAHLCIDDEKVARIHVCINAESAEQLSAVDMGSIEGTFLNGKRINKGQLRFGDELRIGSTRLVIEDGSVPEQEAAPALEQEVLPSAGAAVTEAAAPSQEAAAVQSAFSAPPADTSNVPQQAEPFAASAASSAAAFVSPESVGSLPSRNTAHFSDKAFGSYVPQAPVPRRPSGARKGRLGLNIRYYWGDALLDTFQVGDPATRVLVGTLRPVDSKVPAGSDRCQFYFPPAQLDGKLCHELVGGESGEFTIRLTSSMSGFLDKGDGNPLKKLEPGSFFSMKEGDFAWVDVGTIRIEFSFEQQPKPVIVPFYRTIDYRFIYTLVALLFLVGAFIISASTHTEADIIADDIGEKQLKMVKAYIQEAEKPKHNPLLDQLKKNKEKKAEKPQGGEMAEKHKGQEGKMGRKDMAPNKNKRSAPKAIDINAKDLVKHSGGLVSVLGGGGGGGGGLATIFGQGGLGGDIKGAIGNMHGPQVGDAGGFGGLGLKGTGTGGGGSGNTIGIGGIDTKGRGGGMGGYGVGVGGLGGKKKSDVAISDGESTIQGALDKELIRQVIQRNMGQIRYCYEKELQRKPDLAGKVVIRFKISGSGQVPEAKVHTGTTLKDASATGASPSPRAAATSSSPIPLSLSRPATDRAGLSQGRLGDVKAIFRKSFGQAAASSEAAACFFMGGCGAPCCGAKLSPRVFLMCGPGAAGPGRAPALKRTRQNDEQKARSEPIRSNSSGASHPKDRAVQPEGGARHCRGPQRAQALVGPHLRPRPPGGLLLFLFAASGALLLRPPASDGLEPLADDVGLGRSPLRAAADGLHVDRGDPVPVSRAGPPLSAGRQGPGGVSADVHHGHDVRAVADQPAGRPATPVLDAFFGVPGAGGLSEGRKILASGRRGHGARL